MSTNPSSPDCSDDDSVPAIEPDSSRSMIKVFRTIIHFDSIPPFDCNFIHRLLHDLKEGKKIWVQILTLYAAAILTYGCSNDKINRMAMNVQLVIMAVITFVGASPFLSTHLVNTTIGAFVGGHNIIGSVGSMDDVIVVTCTNYVWLFLLSLVVGLIWRFVMNSKWKVLDGFAGRLGTTVFLGMNLVMLTAYGPFGVVGWDRYYYGLTEVLNSAEDSIPLSRAWFEEAELAIGFVIAIIFLGVQSPAPLNNVLIPVLWALLSMFLVIVSGYENAPVLFNGFAVGSYVAMASLQRIPSIGKFVVISVLAAGWGLTLIPFFVGFPGKSGFTAMLGHVTCCLIETIQIWLRIHRKSNEHHRRDTSLEDNNVYPQQDQLRRQHVLDQEAPDSPHNERHFKPKTETSVITKHQRRQQRKLKHLHLHNSSEGEEGTEDPPKHHRAWSAVKAEADDGAWRHSLESRQEWNNLV
ncbi:hypothetical protein HJC23_000956 [Cyclotella cryptica]|uniref:Urea transporter n=1 Tax=Cyclotella cryptica TaxID=29204 RepID=A0ABD3QMK8_9STRA